MVWAAVIMAFGFILGCVVLALGLIAHAVQMTDGLDTTDDEEKPEKRKRASHDDEKIHVMGFCYNEDEV